MIQFNTFEWETIGNWYKKNGRKNFPWRDYSLSKNQLLYHVWLSEILLQQTQAERVIGFYVKILEKFPTIGDLAKADYEEFFSYYKGLGYYSRAKNLLKTAKIITEEYNGIFPEQKSILKKLPGIGEYTSSAILAFGYGKPILAFDTNLEKIFSRYFFGNSTQKLSENEKNIILQDFEKFIYSYQEKEQINIIRNINNGLMDFARIIDSTSPEKINWEKYPIRSGKFYESRGKYEIITKKKIENFPTPDAKIIAILHENHKSYFSENSTIYHPFILNPSLDRDTRKFVKNFFKEKYSLEVSVRPVHKKFFKNNEPFVAVNVQIQTGKNNFTPFSKIDAQKVLKNFLSEI